VSQTVPAVDIEALRTLITVAQLGSMSAAAAQLGITQQAVSFRMRKLETVLGRALVVRRPRGTALTSDGALIAEWANDVVTSAERFHHLAAGLGGAEFGVHRVAASLTIATQLLPGWLIQLEMAGVKAPTFTATNSASVIAGVRNGSADIGFIETPDVPADLATRVVATDELVVVVAPDHPWTRRRSIDAAELARTPLVVREAGSGTRQTLEQALLDHPSRLVLVPPAAIVPTSSGVRAAVASGVSPAALSILAVRDALRSGALKLVRIADLRVIRPLSAVWFPEQPLSPDTQKLLNIAMGGHLGIHK
jgi:DNA-binding transcriptional LysR family regulator